MSVRERVSVRRRPAVLIVTPLCALTLAGAVPGCGGRSATDSAPSTAGRPTVVATPTTGTAAPTTTGTAAAGTVAASRSAAGGSGGSGGSAVTPAGPTTLPAGLAGRDWEALPAAGATMIALTFDAGSGDAGLASVLATLDRTGTPGTFFLTGDFVDDHPEAARRIAAGHRVGNHTATHPRLTRLDDAAVRTEITGGADRIRAVTGADPRPWFRFPFGDRDARTIAGANRLGFVAVRWTVDSLGWQGAEKGGQTVATVTARVLAAARPGGIVLMHVGENPDDGSTLDADALPGVIEGLRREGYRLVDLDALRG